ncbi:G-D-S-L family lipolytic protein [[Phormidium ambiguum] IAM M-71]|uniref:G-D-S-L family lipolytic protein n=1 Tax=[Phormidium ambiguum] IAM M-71 TaxID=454136 RepID=A0A1U7ISP6_9CYAN|nr:GDSL-type esterase/lipase family protein [Phormidium ambiguum]OKH40520.1 G-D-S-L family lipolytic protein [Phormidium ambiguum IAM M-71]
MTDRTFKSVPKRLRSSRVLTSVRNYPTWALLSLAINGLLILIVGWLLRDGWWPVDYQISPSVARESLTSEIPTSTPGLGKRHQLTYQKWINILQQEAEVTAKKQPSHLNVLLGDSLSLWFPPDLLPTEKNWLNQGISGEISQGLWRRLSLFDRTQPERIYVMIGINDLIRGVDDRTLLKNYRKIVRRLRRVHPQSQIVVQAILPHGGEESTWEGRDRLIAIPITRIQQLNQELAAIAQEEEVKFLDLYPLFTNPQGHLRADLTTDGLHLNRQGYLVWRSAIQMYAQLVLGEQEKQGNREMGR